MVDMLEFSVDPLELSGNIPEDRAIFYELAKNRIQYQSRVENRSWLSKFLNRNNEETTATFVVGHNNHIDESGNVQKFVNSLKIVVNIGILDDFAKSYGESCRDLVPALVEHEIYEAWLAVKRGVGGMEKTARHMLARRREVYLIAQAGLSKKWLEYQKFINPYIEDEYMAALEYARRRLKENS